jgi:hypothetical protein
MAHPPLRGFQILMVFKRTSVERQARRWWRTFPRSRRKLIPACGLKLTGWTNLNTFSKLDLTGSAADIGRASA